MSIVTSRDELEQAKNRLATVSDDVLTRDLVDWTVASFKSAEQYRELVTQQLAVRDLHAEEETWIGLIAEELRRRRTRSRESIS
jgi:hypothetical protein